NCDAVNCGPGNNCTRDESGDPSCSCSTGFTPSSDKLSCIGNCAAVDCGPGNNCILDANGNPSCNCSTTYTLSPDKLSCIGKCSGVDCGIYGYCDLKENGDPTCKCLQGAQLLPDKLFCANPECDVLGCEPYGRCVYKNGTHSCQWDSVCGKCPMRADCVKVYTTTYEAADVPYCKCRRGYGLTSKGCEQGLPDEVAASSMTLIRDAKARDKTSNPYTFRLKYGCTRFPEEVAGNFSLRYEVHNIGGALGCRQLQLYSTDNCTSTPAMRQTVSDATISAIAARGSPFYNHRSVWCGS
ncbi:unnamed protein product, partial [Closterium sp. Naga37s-1]